MPAVDADKLPRVAVFGTRTMDDENLVRDRLDRYLRKLGKVVVCTGAGRFYARDYKSPKGQHIVGADYFAELWAFAHGHTVMRFHPDFEKYKSPAAFHVRNRELVDFVSGRRPCYAVAFWDGKSAGTKSVIELCRKAKIQLKVVRY